MSFLNKKIKIVAFLSILTLAILIPTLSNVHADVGCPTGSVGCDGAGYQALAPLTDKDGIAIPTDLGGYITGVFFLAIGLASILAVVVIIYGGILYMSTDAYTQKSEGKKIIQRTLWGIAIIVISYIILLSINPKLLNVVTFTNVADSTPQSPTQTRTSYCFKYLIDNTTTEHEVCLITMAICQAEEARADAVPNNSIAQTCAAKTI